MTFFNQLSRTVYYSLKINYLLIICVGIFYLSCSNKDVPVEPNKEDIEFDLGEYKSDYPSNLNVVYFVPSDQSALKDYHKRISGIMLHMQDWYKNEMNRNGFGQRTFGLLKSEFDSNYVKVSVVNGKYGKSTYPYEGGGGKVGQEVQESFNQHPEEESSEHTLIFMPSTQGQHGWDAGGPPFYGLGRWAYVLDYENFDMSVWRDGSKEGDFNWIGGTIHELGHSLNLPHNQHKYDDGWTSMMSWGNHEYNQSPNNVHLTKASSMILNNCEVFNKEEGKVFYDQIPSHNIKSLKIYSDESKLYLKSKFESEVPINAVIAYVDPKTSPGDANYNAISWATNNIINNDSISIEMPLSSINPEYLEHSFELRLRFCHINGDFSFETFQFEIENNKPSIDIDFKEVPELEKSQWSIVDYSSEEKSGEGSDNGHALHAIDGNVNTFWQSQWVAGSPGYPHYLTVDLNDLEAIKGFTFKHRNSKYNGRPKSITIKISEDGTVFESLGDYTLKDLSLKQYIELNEEKTFKYFKIIINSGHDNENGENIFFMHLAEVGIYLIFNTSCTFGGKNRCTLLITTAREGLSKIGLS